MTNSLWWKDAVVYQIYPRSFADANGDGIGDIAGIISKVPYLKELGVDAVWISPFYPSPGADAGYDVSDYMSVGEEFGTLSDFDHLVSTLHDANIRIIMDIVPNHCSVEHELFKKAIAAGPGSVEREVFHFRDGKGVEGSNPPNNWQSHFGGPAWTRLVTENGIPEQWYLHLFDSGQPDFNWDNPVVHEYFDEVLTFWLERGVDGFRIDVAHLLFKHPDLPDWNGPSNGAQHPDYPTQESPMFGLDKGHDVYRRWRKMLDRFGEESGRERAMCGEVCVQPLTWQAQWGRSDEMHTLFNFAFFDVSYSASDWASTIEESLAAFGQVGAPTTWVFSNHDVVRHPTRLGYPTGVLPRPGDGVGPQDPRPNLALGHRRARAVSALLMSLPGTMYIYQGEELGLPDNIDIPDDRRVDPTYLRTHGVRIGRDGCRVPLPWKGDLTAYGFSPDGKTWLPQPDYYAEHAVTVQLKDAQSCLHMYRRMIALRKRLGLGTDGLPCEVHLAEPLVIVNRGSVLIACNFSDSPMRIPSRHVDVSHAQVLFASVADAWSDGVLAPDCAVWLSI